LLAICVVTFWPHDNEPKYNGKTLTQWLEISRSRRYDNRWPQAEDAVRHIGTNALPWLTKWISYETPKWQNQTAQWKVWRFLPRQLHSLVYDRDFQVMCAMEGFRILAPTSPQGSAELARLMDGWPSRSATRALVTVFDLGPSGLPIFFNMATNRTAPPPLRCAALQGIEFVFSGQKTNTANFSTNTIPLIPGLVRCLEEPDPTIRAAAANTLRTIAPDVATNRIRALGY
jgi:hypothetical protein